MTKRRRRPRRRPTGGLSRLEGNPYVICGQLFRLRSLLDGRRTWPPMARRRRMSHRTRPQIADARWMSWLWAAMSAMGH
jgi:hypothetical protein